MTTAHAHAELILEGMAFAAEDNIWEGHLTKLFKALKVPLAYYPQVLVLLETSGCAAQLQRGSAHKLSKWQILSRDPLQLATGKTISDKNKSRLAIVEGEVRDLRLMVKRLETQVNLLNKVVLK